MVLELFFEEIMQGYWVLWGQRATLVLRAS
jgi:hypothetical protein